MAVSVATNPVPGSGSLSFSTLRNTLTNDTGSVSLSNYYKGGSKVPNATQNASLPTSGAISVSNFRNCISKVTATITGVEVNVVASSILSGYYTSGLAKTIKIQGTVISQTNDPAMTVDGGSPTVVGLDFQGGTINGHRGIVQSVNGLIVSLSSYDNGIPIPTYQSYEQVGQNCYDVCPGGKAGCYQQCDPVYGYVTREYGPAASGTANITGGSGTKATMSWYYWSQNGRISWQINNPGIGYIQGDNVSFAAAGYGSFTISISTDKGGQGGGGNSGGGYEGNPGRTALLLNNSVVITSSNGAGGAIRGGGGQGGGGGGGGQEGGGGRNTRHYCCGWFCPQCTRCDGGVGGGGDTGGSGGQGGQGKGYSWDGTNLVLNGPSGGSGGYNPGNGGGVGGTGGSGGDWGNAGATGDTGGTGSTGPGGDCAGGGGGSGGGPGGAGGPGGKSIIGINYVTSRASSVSLSGGTA